jgi:hypothetical protein
VSRGKNAADIDERLPERLVTSTLVDQKARLKGVPKKNAGKFGAGNSLLICGVRSQSCRCAAVQWEFDRDSETWYDSTASKASTTGGEL